MKLNNLDRAIVRATLATNDQGEIAEIVGASKSAVTHSLLRLRKAGMIDLERDGQKHVVKLSLVRKLQELLAALECTPTYKAGTA